MKNVAFVTFLMIAAIFFANQAVANMYKWVDANGVTHFSDVPPPTKQKTTTIETTDYPDPVMEEETQDAAKGEAVVDPEPAPRKVVEKKKPKTSKMKKKKPDQVAIYTTAW